MMGSQAAIQYVMDEFGYPSCYSIAKELSSHYGDKNVQPGQVMNYHRGRKVMGKKTAELFYTVFGVEIGDYYVAQGRPSEWQ